MPGADRTIQADQGQDDVVVKPCGFNAIEQIIVAFVRCVPFMVGIDACLVQQERNHANVVGSHIPR